MTVYKKYIMPVKDEKRINDPALTKIHKRNRNKMNTRQDKNVHQIVTWCCAIAD